MRLLKMVKPATSSTPYLHTRNGYGWTIGESRRPEVFDLKSTTYYSTTPRLCSWTVLHAFLSFEQAYFCAGVCSTKGYSVPLLAESTGPVVMAGNKVGVQELTVLADVTKHKPSWFPGPYEYGAWSTQHMLKRKLGAVVPGLRKTYAYAFDESGVKVVYRHLTGRRWPEAHQYTAKQQRRTSTEPYHDELIRFWTEQFPELWSTVTEVPPVKLADLEV